ncbi:MAG: class I SAM-dependent methyltransferase [Candidatus Omnitrophota bacterium]
MYEKVLSDFKVMGSPRIRRQVQNVLGLINLSSNEKIMEIGVATGKFTSIATRQNSVFAIDIAFDNLQRAKRAVSEMGNIKNLFPLNADCSSMPFADSVFDKILAIDITEHLTDEIFFLLCKESYRVLKKDGSFFIYTPNLLHPYELARPFRPVLRKEHVGVRTRAKLCGFLKRAAFKIKRRYFNNCFRRISIEAVK